MNYLSIILKFKWGIGVYEKDFFCVLFCLVSLFTFASEENGLGIVDDADLRAAGVKAENIKKG